MTGEAERDYAKEFVEKEDARRKQVNAKCKLYTPTKTRGEIFPQISGKRCIGKVEITRGTRGSLSIETRYHRVEIHRKNSNHFVCRESHFYSDGGWKDTGRREYAGCSAARDAVRDAMSRFLWEHEDLAEFLEAPKSSEPPEGWEDMNAAELHHAVQKQEVD